MGVFNAQYPEDLRKVVGHAQRLAKILARMEADPAAGRWFLGRSGELRAVVSCTIADWRAGVFDNEKARDAIVSYVDGLHRDAAKKLRGRAALECCSTDEAITAVADGSSWTSVSRADGAAAAGLTSEASTVRAGWVDGPDVLARFQGELGRVEVHARVLARRIGEACATFDDLRAFGREGLLDAARSFDEARGVPFGQWATLRIRSAMIDGVRRWGSIPRRVRRELRVLEAAELRARPHDDGQEGSHASDSEPATYTDVAAGCLGQTPEEMVVQAELVALVRDVVARLPKAERELVQAYYFGEQTLAQASAAAGVGKSRGSRLHERAIEAMEREFRRLDVSSVGLKSVGRKP